MRTLPSQLQDKVLLAADLLAERGLDGTKTEDIAAATGIPKATLYYYFEGKEDILAFLFGRVLDEVTAAIAAAVNGPGTPAERLAAAVRAHLGVYERLPGASRALHLDLGRAARLPDVVARSDESFVQPIRRLLDEGAADGSLRRFANTRVVATALLGAITATGANAMAGHPSRRRTNQVAKDLLELVVGGTQP